ncbi:MAG: hypothetical protein EBX52_02025 [Proteobacteria bacterium]|nr:hypothetical protein [Pseudomonadota bacterium]
MAAFFLHYPALIFFGAFAGAETIFHCEKSRTPGLETCIEYKNSNRKKCLPNSQPGNFEDLKDLISTPISPDFCSENDWKLANERDAKEIRKIEKNLKQECRAKAKEFKKAVLNDLIENHRFGQALKVLLKRKRYRSGVLDGTQEANTIKIDGTDLDKMSTQDLNLMVQTEIGKLYPGIVKKAEETLKKNPSFQYGFHENERVPINLMLKTEGGACVSKLNDLEPVKPFEPKECRFCKVQPVKNNFVNDCSYMVGKDFPQSKADELIGSNDKNRKNFCQKSLEKGPDSDMADIDAAANQICDIAKQGMDPDFSIQTSRNLYPDLTPDLAEKRGAFIQKYIRNKLLDGCKLLTVPEWLSKEDEFSKKVKWSPPYYDGAKPGDYGPDPNAPKELRDQEGVRLRNTLQKEKSEIEKRIANLSDEIALLRKEADLHDGNLKKAYSDYSSVQNRVSNDPGEDAKSWRTIQSEAMKDSRAIVDRVEDILELRNSTLQKISDLDTEKKSLALELSKHSDSVIQAKTEALRQYYQEKDTNGNDPGFYQKWDQALFNDFKMVRITGKAAKNSAQMATSTELDPKLDVMLNLIARVDEYSCVIDPIETKSLTLKGYAKGAGQFVMGSLALTGYALGGTAFAGVAIINSFLSLVCIGGCGQPGNQLPKWRLVGNLFHVGNKSQRQHIWHRIKEKTGDFITVGGKLRLNTDNYKNVNTYNDFESYARRYYGDQFNSRTDLNPDFKPIESRDSKGQIEWIGKYDRDENLIEFVEYDEKGNVSETTRFNKDGQRISTSE